VARTAVTAETTRTNEFTMGCVRSGAVRTETVAVYGPYVTRALRHLVRMERDFSRHTFFNILDILRNVEVN
jgi:hypothetical protein